MKYNYTIKSLLLIFAMIMSVCGAWAEDVTVTIPYTDLPSVVGSNNGSSGSIKKTVSTSEDLTVAYAGINLQSAKGSKYTYAMFLSGKGYMYSTTAPSGYYVKSIKATFSSGTGETGTIGATFGSAAITTRNSTVSGAVRKSGTYSVTNTDETKVYWNLSTNGANVQILTVEVVYSTAGGSSKTLSSIAVSGTPTKTTYFDGDKFDPAGLVVTGTYSDSNTETITSGITWNVTPETLTTGTTSVSVTATVGEKTSASYTVNGLTVNKYPYIKDKLTQTVTGVSGTSYGNFSGKSVVSDAVYAGNCAGGSGSVQLRSTSNSGVISTTSGGYIRKVSVEWNASTMAGRVLDVYGSNTPYTSAADLYATNKRGTKLGSITKGTSTSLTITGDYKYVGIRSNEGAMYLTSVTFEWEEIPVCPVTFRKAGNGYSTLYTSETALSIPEGVEAYYCTLKENGNMEPHALTSVIPASTPVVLHYTGELTDDKTINFAHSTEEGEDASANVLRGTDEALDITSLTDNDFYVLSIVDGQVGFYKFGGDELAAGKAYYMTDKTPAGGEEYDIVFGEEGVTVTPADESKTYVFGCVNESEIKTTVEDAMREIFLKEWDVVTGVAYREYCQDLCWFAAGTYYLCICDYDAVADAPVGDMIIKEFVLNDSFELVSHASTRGFILDFGFDAGNTTGVSNVQTIAPAAKASFDLQGRRVMGNAKGLVIKNGRVMLNR